MKNIVYILVAVTSIQSIGWLYIIYRLALLVKAKDLYEARSYTEKTPETTMNGEDFSDMWPITSNLFADVTPSR